MTHHCGFTVGTIRVVPREVKFLLICTRVQIQNLHGGMSNASWGVRGHGAANIHLFDVDGGLSLVKLSKHSTRNKTFATIIPAGGNQDFALAVGLLYICG